jgi:phage terminase small subunit
MSDLTPKQEAFCLAYLATGNASAAYRQVYDVSPDTKPNTIEKRACELLKNGKVAGRVTALRAEAATKATLSKSWVLQHLIRQVRITMGDEKIALTIRPKGKDGEDAAPVSVEVSARDANAANKALELLARHLGLFEADVTAAGAAAGKAAGEALGKEITDLEAARRIAFLFGRVVGRQDKSDAPPVGQQGEPDDARDQH